MNYEKVFVCNEKSSQQVVENTLVRKKVLQNLNKLLFKTWPTHILILDAPFYDIQLQSKGTQNTAEGVITVA